MAPLRILHVTPYSADAWAYGGIPRVADLLARGLSRRGHHVTICTTDVCDAGARLAHPRGGRRRWRGWQATTAAHGPTVHVFPNLSNRLAYHLQAYLPLGVSSFLRRHAAGFDVAHLHACRNLPGVIAGRHLARAGVPYVLAPNGTAPRIERRQRLKRAFDAVAGDRLLAEAARVLAVSAAERRDLLAIGVDDDRVATIPNPVDLTGVDDATIARGAFRREMRLAGPLVLFLGKITPRKHVDTLVAAVAAMPRSDVTLVVAGNDMGGGAAAAARAHALGIADRVRFTGLLAGAARLDALADADVVAYPSAHEVFGLVACEALACGTPVVVGDDSGCAEVVRAAGGGLAVPAGDAGALAAALTQILAAPEHWRASAADAAAQVRHRYADDAVCDTLERLYGELVSWNRHSVTDIPCAAPGSQGATTENIGDIRGRSNAASRGPHDACSASWGGTRDAPRGICQRISVSGH